MHVTRWGILSTANINRVVIAGARLADVEVVAVASRDRARADTYAREYDIPRAHGSYDALLADDGVDAVYISLPNSLHHEWTMRALEAGKHVLCEKPYTPSRRRRRGGIRPRGAARPRALRGVHVAPQPADEARARVAAGDRRAADDPRDVRVRAHARDRRPPPRRPRRRRADGRRLLLRQRRAPARGGARARAGRAGRRPERSRRPLHRHAPLRERRHRRVHFVVHVRAQRPRGDRQRRQALRSAIRGTRARRASSSTAARRPSNARTRTSCRSRT